MSTSSQKSIPCPQILPANSPGRELFESVNEYVYDFMSRYDNSHDYQHILRVLSNAYYILITDVKAQSKDDYRLDGQAVLLAALLHDVGDHKYAKPGEDTESQIRGVLKERGASDYMANKVQAIAKHVSYSNEVKNPESVLAVLREHPELAIVQDADRLDAIGAVGVARCFSFGAAKYPKQPMSRSIDHFEEKLYKLKGMMKTQIGKEMAERRHQALKDFAAAWEDETKFSFEVV